MGRIIINFEDVAESEAISLVRAVISNGRISKGPNGDQYCWASISGDVSVFAEKTEAGTDVFRVYKK